MDGIRGQTAAALRSLVALTRMLDVDAVPEDMRYVLFAKALARRVGGDARRMNLYPRRFELPDMAGGWPLPRGAEEC